MPPKFIYFDLGKVLLRFDRQRQYRQMADVLAASPEQIRQIVEQHDLINRYETSGVSAQGVFDTMCEALGRSCDFDELERAGSDIFWLNTALLPLIVDLVRCRHRLGQSLELGQLRQRQEQLP